LVPLGQNTLLCQLGKTTHLHGYKQHFILTKVTILFIGLHFSPQLFKFCTATENVTYFPSIFFFTVLDEQLVLM